MRVGVGVEGPPDRAFWHVVPHKHFDGIQFDVRTMGSKETLIRQTPLLLEAFRSLQFTAGFVLVDLDRDPCFGSVLERFNETIRGEARSPVYARYLFCLRGHPWARILVPRGSFLWASYTHNPENKTTCFLGRPDGNGPEEWIESLEEQPLGGRVSAREADTLVEGELVPDGGLFHNIRLTRYGHPFFSDAGAT